MHSHYLLSLFVSTSYFSHSLSLQAMLGSFLARAVIDEVLPPAFLSNRNNTHPGDEVVAKAVSLLSREHCSARLEKVWGPGDGRPVEELKEIMDQLLKVCTSFTFFLLRRPFLHCIPVAHILTLFNQSPPPHYTNGVTIL